MHTPLMTDLYQLTMGAGYFHSGRHDHIASFELFVRKLPKNRNYLVFAGLETVVEYLRNLRFTDSQIQYMKTIPNLRKAMTFEFCEFLRDFRFKGDLIAMPEGTIFFGQEPVLRVTGTLFETQLVETFLLSAVNTQTMVASKASRMRVAAQDKRLLEFGTRRTSPEEAIMSARAAYIAGFDGTSNVEAGYRYDIPVAGTMAHSWMMAHDSEEAAFTAYAKVFPESSTLLVDTYDTIAGIKKAIEVAGKDLQGIRLDSGDLLDLSKKARAMLDAKGLQHAIIIASGDLNESKIEHLVEEGAPIDAFGVGTELVRSKDNPTLGGVYKLVTKFEGPSEHDDFKPVMKKSEGKMTLPGRHQVYRVTEGKACDTRYVRDILGTIEEFHASTLLLQPIMRKGKLLASLASLPQIRLRVRRQMFRLQDHFKGKSIDDTWEYPVTLSIPLEQLVNDMMGKKAKHE